MCYADVMDWFPDYETAFAAVGYCMLVVVFEFHLAFRT